MTGFHYLSDQVLESVGISQQEIADAIESALLAQAAGEIWTAPKAAVLPGDGRYMMTTLSVSDAPQVIAVKAVSVSPRNPDRGLSAINGAITLFDSETGVLKAVLDANWVTAVRTAGLSAVAARRLADPKSRTIAFVGCGGKWIRFDVTLPMFIAIVQTRLGDNDRPIGVLAPDSLQDVNQLILLLIERAHGHDNELRLITRHFEIFGGIISGFTETTRVEKANKRRFGREVENLSCLGARPETRADLGVIAAGDRAND